MCGRDGKPASKPSCVVCTTGTSAHVMVWGHLDTDKLPIYSGLLHNRDNQARLSNFKSSAHTLSQAPFPFPYSVPYSFQLALDNTQNGLHDCTARWCFFWGFKLCSPSKQGQRRGSSCSAADTGAKQQLLPQLAVACAHIDCLIRRFY
jgi:hypothetical protein